MRTIYNCICCGSDKHSLLYPATYSGNLQEAHRYFLALRHASAHGDIRRCASCRFTFTSPQFEETEYDAIYSRLGNNNSDQAPTGGPGAVATERRYSRLRDLIAQHTRFNLPFLDFGCGDGGFLQAADSTSGVGFEIGEPGARKALSGNNILSGRFHELAGTTRIPWESQAFVTAFDVLEHLPALTRDIELIRRVIRPGGYLFVTVPNAGSVMARVARHRWNMLLLEHLWYFNQATLDIFLAKSGFLPVTHCSVPYDASVGHVAKRLGESFSFRGAAVPHWLRERVLPVPAGVLFGAYRRKD